MNIVASELDEIHLLAGLLEAYFGSLFFYKSSSELGATQYLFASLADVRTYVRTSASANGSMASQVADWMESIRAEGEQDSTNAPEEVQHTWGRGDVVFGLSYELGALVLADFYGETLDGGHILCAEPEGQAELLAFAGRIDEVVVYDVQSRKYYVSASSPTRQNDIETALARARAQANACSFKLIDDPGAELTWGIEFDADAYRQKFDAAEDEFSSGEVYQAVISIDAYATPRETISNYFASAARRYTDAIHHYWVSFDGLRMFGFCSLPHIYLERGEISTRIFAGTKAIGEEELEVTTASFRGDARFYAEHVMLVDVERNDFASVCQLGTVDVSRFMYAINVGPTRYLASDITGRLRPNVRWSDAVLANLPRAVVLGAPKSSAVNVVTRLEGRPRGFYGGVTGIVSASGHRVVSNTNVTYAVRTESDQVLLQCAGGVTAASSSQQELAELEMKLRYLR